MHDPFWSIDPAGHEHSKLPGVLTHSISGSGQELTTEHSLISITERGNNE